MRNWLAQIALLLLRGVRRGGMVPCLCATKGDAALGEENYYSSDFTPQEREEGLHRAVLGFAAESRSQRGFAGSDAVGAGCLGAAHAVHAVQPGKPKPRAAEAAENAAKAPM